MTAHHSPTTPDLSAGRAGPGLAVAVAAGIAAAAAGTVWSFVVGVRGGDVFDILPLLLAPIAAGLVAVVVGLVVNVARPGRGGWPFPAPEWPCPHVGDGLPGPCPCDVEGVDR